MSETRPKPPVPVFFRMHMVMDIRKDSKTRDTDFSGGLSASNPETSVIFDIFMITGVYIGSFERKFIDKNP